MRTTGLEIHLVGGAVFTVDAKEFEVVKDRGSQRVTKLKWVTPDDANRRLVTIDLDQIVAVVEMIQDEPEQNGDDPA